METTYGTKNPAELPEHQVAMMSGKKTDYIPLNAIKIYEEPISNINSKSIRNSTMLSIPTTNLSLNLDSETIQEQEEYIDVILECDTIVYEYFKVKPLKNMIVYDTEERINEFRSKYEYLSKYEISNSINKFYIVANDRETMIISTVLHTLQYVRILEPRGINDKLISIFKSYSLRNKLKICNDETPPTPSNPSEPSSKNEDIKSNKSIQKDTELFKKEKEKVKNMKDNLSL
jgi:hypothetical protein